MKQRIIKNQIRTNVRTLIETGTVHKRSPRSFNSRLALSDTSTVTSLNDYYHKIQRTDILIEVTVRKCAYETQVFTHLFAEDASLCRYLNDRALAIETLSRVVPLSAANVCPLDEEQARCKEQPRRAPHPAD